MDSKPIRAHSFAGRLVFAGVSLLVPLSVSCDQRPPSSGPGQRPLVVCTTTMIADLAGQIAGDRVRVVGLMPPGVNPHTYEPKPDDSIVMGKAALILYNGLHLEGKMARLFEEGGRNAVGLAEDSRIKTRESEQYKGAPDPHCWWNARNFMVYAERTRDALVALDPAGHADYERRANAYLAQLAELDDQIRAAVQRIPSEKRYLVTSHDAFFYYGEAYGLHVDAVLGISTDADVRPLRIEELARLVVQNRIPAIFHETAVADSLNEMVTRVVEHAARHGHTVTIPREPLYSDSIDVPGTPAATYLGALRENTRIIVSALSGEDVSALLQPKEPVRDDDAK